MSTRKRIRAAMQQAGTNCDLSERQFMALRDCVDWCDHNDRFPARALVFKDLARLGLVKEAVGTRWFQAWAPTDIGMSRVKGGH